MTTAAQQDTVGQEPQYLIVSLKHTRTSDPYVTFWRTDDLGYAWPLSWAGRYPESVIKERMIHHGNMFETFPVPVDVADALAQETPKGMVDNDAGPIVPNSPENVEALREASLRLSIGWERDGAFTMKHVYEGHSDALSAIGDLLLEDFDAGVLRPKERTALLKARADLYNIGFYGWNDDATTFLKAAQKAVKAADKRLEAENPARSAPALG